MSIDQINYNAHILKIENEYDVKRELFGIKTDSKAFDLIKQKMLFVHIKLEQVDTRAANIIKQEIHSFGGVAAISKDAYNFTERTTDMIISGSRKILDILSKKIVDGRYGLSEISKEIERCLNTGIGIMEIRDKIFDFNKKTYMVGVVGNYNLDGYADFNLQRILRKIEKMVSAGVDIINIASDDYNQPNLSQKDKLKSIENLKDIIKEAKKKFPNIVLSIDLPNIPMAKILLDENIDMVNRITPIRFNEELLNLIAKKKIPAVLISNLDKLSANISKPIISVSDVIKDIHSNINYVLGRGIKKEKLIVDPGIGFGMSDKDNFLVLGQLSSFKHLGLPIMVGLSKRSFLSEALKGRMRKTHLSTIAANTLAIINGANIIRVYVPEQVAVMASIIDSVMKLDDRS